MNRRTAKRSSDLPCGAHRHDVPLDSEYSSFQLRHANSAERLQGMHAANSSSAFFQWGERPRIPGAAGVEHDLAAQFFAAHAGEFAGYAVNRVIGRGNQDSTRHQKMTRHAAIRFPCSNETDRAS